MYVVLLLLFGLIDMKDNYLFNRVYGLVDEFEHKHEGWWIYPVPKALSGVYLDLMYKDDDCYDGVYITSVRQAKEWLRWTSKFLEVKDGETK